MGAMFGAADEIAFDDPRLDDFATALDKDTSALVLTGEEVTLTDFVSGRIGDRFSRPQLWPQYRVRGSLAIEQSGRFD
jgi:hypothetical protein